MKSGSLILPIGSQAVLIFHECHNKSACRNRQRSWKAQRQLCDTSQSTKKTTEEEVWVVTSTCCCGDQAWTLPKRLFHLNWELLSHSHREEAPIWLTEQKQMRLVGWNVIDGSFAQSPSKPPPLHTSIFKQFKRLLPICCSLVVHEIIPEDLGKPSGNNTFMEKI